MNHFQLPVLSKIRPQGGAKCGVGVKYSHLAQGIYVIRETYMPSYDILSMAQFVMAVPDTDHPSVFARHYSLSEIMTVIYWPHGLYICHGLALYVLLSLTGLSGSYPSAIQHTSTTAALQNTIGNASRSDYFCFMPDRCASRKT